MHKGSGHEIARRPVCQTTLLPHARGGEGFEFAERNAGGFLMRRHQPFIIQRHRQHRYGFGRRAGEIKKYPALVRLQLSLRQTLIILRIQVFTQRMKLFAGDIIL